MRRMEGHHHRRDRRSRLDRASCYAPQGLEIGLALPTVQRARVDRPATGRPDFDSLAKAVGDALMEPSSRALIAATRKLPECCRYAGVVADGAGIVRLIATKRWSLKPGESRIILRDSV